MKKYFLLLSEPEINLIIKGLSEIPVIAPSPANPMDLKRNIINQCRQLELELNDGNNLEPDN